MSEESRAILRQLSNAENFVPTFNFRWLTRGDEKRVLQQMFVDPSSPDPFELIYGVKWRDVPEVRE